MGAGRLVVVVMDGTVASVVVVEIGSVDDTGTVLLVDCSVVVDRSVDVVEVVDEDSSVVVVSNGVDSVLDTGTLST